MLTSLSAQMQLIHFINDLHNFTGKEVQDKKQPAKKRRKITCTWMGAKCSRAKVLPVKEPQPPKLQVLSPIFWTRFCTAKINVTEFAWDAT